MPPEPDTARGWSPDGPTLARLLARIDGSTPGPGGVRVVGIDGRSGSGKTDLAMAVAAVRACTVVHLDDAYAGWLGLAAAVTVLDDQVLTPLAQGRPGRFRRYDWATGRHAERVVVAPTGLVLVEGVGALAGVGASAYSLSVWLEAPAALRRKRALRRDGGVFAPHWQEWADQESALFADGRARRAADVVLDTGHG